jgi:hypothetical protein
MTTNFYKIWKPCLTKYASARENAGDWRPAGALLICPIQKQKENKLPKTKQYIIISNNKKI